MKREVPAASPAAAQHDQGKSLDGSAISAHDKTTVPPSPASPGTTGDAQSASAKENQHTVDVDVLEHEWRDLYPVAWTDFLRFLEGWSPQHHKVHRYSRSLAARVLRALD